MNILIKNIDEVVRDLEKIIIQNSNNFIDAESHTDYLYYRLYLNNNITLDKNSYDLFVHWFSKNFDYLKIKYNDILKTDAVLLTIKHDIYSSINYLIEQGKLRESLLKAYFEKEVLND